LRDRLHLPGGHRQQDAVGGAATDQVPGGVGEGQAVSSGEPEQRAQRDDGPDYQGRGLATEAAESMLTLGFDAMAGTGSSVPAMPAITHHRG
jgi:RimJ/RimL family protein N-acetyltransferase